MDVFVFVVACMACRGTCGPVLGEEDEERYSLEEEDDVTTMRTLTVAGAQHEMRRRTTLVNSSIASATIKFSRNCRLRIVALATAVVLILANSSRYHHHDVTTIAVMSVPSRY